MTRSAQGMAMIANDIADAMDLLVARASKQPKSTRSAGSAEQAPASNTK